MSTPRRVSEQATGAPPAPRHFEGAAPSPPLIPDMAPAGEAGAGLDRPVHNPQPGTRPSGQQVVDSLEKLVGALFTKSTGDSGLFQPLLRAFTKPTLAPEARQVALLDAWHASHSDPVTLGLAREHLMKDPQKYLDLFPGVDDRREVPAEWLFVWHAICLLKITGADGSCWVGTGWLAGPRTVVTAGHCVYLHGQSGGWARQVEVSFVRPGGQEESAPVVATEFRSVSGWVDLKSSLTDYGAVLLPEKDARPADHKLGYGVAPEVEFSRQHAAVVGACADKQPSRALWVQLRAIREAQPRRFLFDRSVFGGLSGSPVIVALNGQPTVVGVQEDGDFAGSAVVRITQAVRRNLDAWVG